MNDAWDAQRGLSCLLEAINHPEWDTETDRDIVQRDPIRAKGSAGSRHPSQAANAWG